MSYVGESADKVSVCMNEPLRLKINIVFLKFKKAINKDKKRYVDLFNVIVEVRNVFLMAMLNWLNKRPSIFEEVAE